MPDPKREFAVEVVRRLKQAGYHALWAGGCVRDMLLGLDPDDYDVATTARPDQVSEVFGSKRTILVGESFGVIIVKGPHSDANVEVATFRKEGPYIDGRRPSSVEYCTAAEDAQRRDFTINGMFYDPLTEQILDYVGGREDIAKKLVRAIGDPHARFDEDKLRMLRAVRITARFSFDLETATGDAIRKRAREILVVSQERIAQELRKMLVHSQRRRALELAAELELLPVILPELAELVAKIRTEPADVDAWRRWSLLRERLQLLQSPSFELALAMTLSDAAEQIPQPVARLVETCCRRLKLSNKELEETRWLLEQRNALGGAAGQSVSKFKRLLVEPYFRNLLAFARIVAHAAGADLGDVEFTERYLVETPVEQLCPPLLLTGDDLIRHGFQPGRQFKAILDEVRDAQLEGRVTSTSAALTLANEIRDRSQ